MKILGIDPGLNVTGYAVLQCEVSRIRVCEAGVIRGGRGGLAERVREIYRSLAEIIQAFHPGALALEELYSHYKRPRTAILMGHARGVICLAAAEAEIPVTPYAATQVKRLLTGHGRASKTQMQLAVCRELGLSDVPEPADVADALAIAICHHHLQTSEAGQH